MKISGSVSMMFREYPLLDRFAAAADAGFDGVEIQFIDEGAPAEMARAANAANIPVVLINLPLADLLTGGPGLSGVPDREEEFAAAAARGLEAAMHLNARFVHVGPSRMPHGSKRKDCLSAYVANISKALDLARAVGFEGVLLAEPMNRVEMPDALFASIDEAAAIVREVNDQRFALLFDIYHVAMNGDDIAGAWDAHGALAPHLQFSDIPGRHEPGTGSLEFNASFAHIHKAGYKGWYGAEYRPRATTIGGLDWLVAMRHHIAG